MRPERPGAEADTFIVGRVIGAHGVRGEMRIEPLTDDPARFERLGAVIVDGREYAVEAFRALPDRLLIKLAGVDDQDGIRPLRGEYLRVPSEQAVSLPAGSYFHYQLLGLRVATTGGEPLGELAEVLPLEANDVYVVRGDAYGEVLVPAVREVVRGIDLDAGTMTVEPLPGLLPEPKRERPEKARR